MPGADRACSPEQAGGGPSHASPATQGWGKGTAAEVAGVSESSGPQTPGDIPLLERGLRAPPSSLGAGQPGAGLRICISPTFPDEAGVAGPGIPPVTSRRLGPGTWLLVFGTSIRHFLAP